MFQRIAAGAVWNAPAYFEFREHRKITLSTLIPHTLNKHQSQNPLTINTSQRCGKRGVGNLVFMKEDEA